jgi:hypothetical protein
MCHTRPPKRICSRLFVPDPATKNRFLLPLNRILVELLQKCIPTKDTQQYPEPQAIQRWHTRATIDDVMYILLSQKAFRFVFVITSLSGNSAARGSWQRPTIIEDQHRYNIG